jgi:shikimate dehydrogenase/3-dehydroquinate dehydratase type I
MSSTAGSSSTQQLCLCLIGSDPKVNMELAARELERVNLIELRIDYLIDCPEFFAVVHGEDQLTLLNRSIRQSINQEEKRQAYLQVPGLDLLISHIQELLDLGKPLILTVRTQSDGGKWTIDREQLRIEVVKGLFWLFGHDSRCIFDFELDCSALTDFLSHPNVESAYEARIIRSFHWFESDWDYPRAYQKLEQLIHLCNSFSPNHNRWIPKAALNCGSVGQLRDLFLLAREVNRSKKQPLLLIGMGEWGMATRILPAWLGSLWSYSTPVIPGDLPAAPGQLDPESLEQVYGFSRLDGSQRVFAILGNPVAHSKSPIYHNQEFVRKDFPGVYIPLRTDSLEDAMDLAELIPLSGMSITIPHKQGIVSYLTCWDPGVTASGACNTVIRGDCGWYGVNTDIPGFLHPLMAHETDTPSGLFNRVLVIGAGGAARAIMYGLSGKANHIAIVNRTIEKAQMLLHQIKDCLPSQLTTQVLPMEEPIEDYFDLIIQTTSLGMDDLSDPLLGYTFRGTEVVYDIIYTPDKTPILVRAEAAGCKVINGWPMFVKQAELQNSLFTNPEV